MENDYFATGPRIKQPAAQRLRQEADGVQRCLNPIPGGLWNIQFLAWALSAPLVSKKSKQRSDKQ